MAKHRKQHDVVIQLPGKGIVGKWKVIFDPKAMPFNPTFNVSVKSGKWSGTKDWYQVWRA